MMCVLTCVLVVLKFGCNDSELQVTPDDDCATSLTTRDEVNMVPFKGDAIFAADLTLVPPVNDCGFGEQFFRRFSGESN